MSVYVALLRGINVGGRKPVAMRDLVALFTRMGFSGVQSLLQSGNVVFHCDSRKSEAALEADIERQIAARLALDTRILLRSDKDWPVIVRKNPFKKEADVAPSRLVLVCLKDAPARKNVELLRASIVGPEQIHARGRELYISYPGGIGPSKLTNAVIERRLGLPGTARNWNTVLKLDALLRASG